MRIEIKNKRLFIDGVIEPLGTHGVLINLQTGQRIPQARFADTDTGEWEAWAVTPWGAQEYPPRLIRGRCPIRFEKSAAPVLSKRPPVRTAAQEQAEIYSIASDYVKDFRPCLQVEGVECEYPGCHKLASWETADEQIIDSGAEGAERGVITKRHKYCADRRHWRAPVSRSQRGVESELAEVVRPE